MLFSAIKILREYERGVVFHARPLLEGQGAGVHYHYSCDPADGARGSAHRRHGCANPGCHLARQRLGQGQRGALHPGDDPAKAIIEIEDYLAATSQLAQTTLRSVLGKHELDEMLAEREKLNLDIQPILDQQTDAWGIKVSNVEIKHVDLDETMIRAIAKQAEAERERRAKVIHAEGEEQAAEKLVKAARILAALPQAMQLRYLQTLTEIAGDKSSTIVFPLPMDVISPMIAKPGIAATAAPDPDPDPDIREV